MKNEKKDDTIPKDDTTTITIVMLLAVTFALVQLVLLIVGP